MHKANKSLWGALQVCGLGANEPTCTPLATPLLIENLSIHQVNTIAGSINDSEKTIGMNPQESCRNTIIMLTRGKSAWEQRKEEEHVTWTGQNFWAVLKIAHPAKESTEMDEKSYLWCTQTPYLMSEHSIMLCVNHCTVVLHAHGKFYL